MSAPASQLTLFQSQTGPGLISGPGLSAVFGGVNGSSVSIGQVAFTPLLTLKGDTYDVYAGQNGGACITGILAGGANVIGATHLRLIPTGTATSLDTATVLDPDSIWELLNPAEDYAIKITCVTSAPGFLATGRKVARNTTIPNVVSAVVNVTLPNVLIVSWDIAVAVRDLVGLSLSFSAGTPRTITGLLTTGSFVSTFSLSGALVGSEVLSFVASAVNDTQSLNGTPSGASTTPVSFI